jgi:hypothetical protein
LKNLVRKAHPTLYQFLAFLQKEQHVNETLHVQYAAGGKRPTKRRRYRNIDSRLALLKRRLEGGALEILQYADECAALLHLE